jgi:hypothetical protein
MKQVALVLVALSVAVQVQAVDREAFLKPGDVTKERVSDMFKAAFLSPTINKLGVIEVKKDEMKVLVVVQPDRGAISFCKAWKLREASRQKKLEFVERLNNKLLLVKFTITKGGALWCQYDLSYCDGGLHRRRLCRASCSSAK